MVLLPPDPSFHRPRPPRAPAADVCRSSLFFVASSSRRHLCTPFHANPRPFFPSCSTRLAVFSSTAAAAAAPRRSKEHYIKRGGTPTGAVAWHFLRFVVVVRLIVLSATRFLSVLSRGIPPPLPFLHPSSSAKPTHTHTHTHIYLCVCVCVYIDESIKGGATWCILSASQDSKYRGGDGGKHRHSKQWR